MAAFTAPLASLTTMLDERNAARARKRREREVRGVARLVNGDLSLIDTSVKLAHQEQEWQWFFPLPHGAWDRDGALIVETLPEDEALVLIETHGTVLGLERLLADGKAKAPPGTTSATIDASVSEVLVPLSGLIAEAKRYLHNLAYPDVRELEPDPDSEIEWRRERKRKRWQWLRHPPRS